MDGTTPHSTSSIRLARWCFSAPDRSLDVAQERHLSNVVVVVVEKGFIPALELFSAQP